MALSGSRGNKQKQGLLSCWLRIETSVTPIIFYWPKQITRPAHGGLGGEGGNAKLIAKSMDTRGMNNYDYFCILP